MQEEEEEANSDGSSCLVDAPTNKRLRRNPSPLASGDDSLADYDDDAPSEKPSEMQSARVVQRDYAESAGTGCCFVEPLVRFRCHHDLVAFKIVHPLPSL